MTPIVAALLFGLFLGAAAGSLLSGIRAEQQILSAMDTVRDTRAELTAANCTLAIARRALVQATAGLRDEAAIEHMEAFTDVLAIESAGWGQGGDHGR